MRPVLLLLLGTLNVYCINTRLHIKDTALLERWPNGHAKTQEQRESRSQLLSAKAPLSTAFLFS